MTEKEKEIISKALQDHFLTLSNVCMHGERQVAYKVAAEHCADMFTGGYGWQLDLQEALKESK